ncbi:MAG: hypothetical protein ACREUG_17915 [Steroidobacteraceae bacterium]
MPNTDRIDVTTPTAHEIYFGALRRNVEQRPRFEDAFFTDLWVRYGTSKATCRHRFDDLNRLVEQMLPADRPLEILDVAVSSGVSTVEWMQSLTRAGIAHRVVAGDAVIEAYLFSFGEHARALVDRTGFLMQLDLAGRAISARPPGCLGRLRFLPAILLVRTLVRLFGSALSGSATREEIRRWGITCRPLRLVTPSLLEQPGAEVVEDDILRTSDLTRLFHVVRAANILNRGYFDVETLRRMLRNLRARLRPDGLLVVCRTMPGGRNQATVFRLAGHGAFSAAARLNSGSEIDELVLSLDGPAC